jgi:predicted alpha/beta-fold hydrolase
MELILDMSKPEQKRKAHEALNPLTGIHRVEVVRYRPRRSDRQNRYYWPCFVKPFSDYLRGQGNEHFTDEMAHEVLKRMFLTVAVVDRNTGAEFERVRSTTELDTGEFNEYLEKVAAFLVTDCGFVVPDPAEYREQVTVTRIEPKQLPAPEASQ